MLLQRQNIDINVADSGGQTALFRAAKAGNEQATGLPLNCPDIEENILDGDYLTRYGMQFLKVMWLLSTSSFGVRSSISSRRMNVYHHIAAVDECYHTIFKVLLVSGTVNRHAADPEGRSALWYAVRRHNCAAVRPLIKSHENVGRQDVDGVTHLDLAVAQGDDDIVRIILKLTAQHRALWAK